jgi:hypothetical protein
LHKPGAVQERKGSNKRRNVTAFGEEPREEYEKRRCQCAGNHTRPSPSCRQIANGELCHLSVWPGDQQFATTTVR